MPYVCDNKVCDWSDYQENEDWGYYSETEGDCSKCQYLCSNDTNCGAVECGDGYCSWWKVGKCIKEEEWTLGNSYSTCRKGKQFK